MLARAGARHGGASTDQSLTDRLGTDGDLHVPHLLDVELLRALRRLARAPGHRAAVELLPGP